MKLITVRPKSLKLIEIKRQKLIFQYVPSEIPYPVQLEITSIKIIDPKLVKFNLASTQKRLFTKILSKIFRHEVSFAIFYRFMAKEKFLFRPLMFMFSTTASLR